MALSDIQIRNAKPGDKPYKLFDAGGLHLAVTPAGGKLWRLKYRLAGKEKLLSLGAYPALSLADARKAADAARRELASGSDPAREKQRAKVQARLAAGDTFEAVAREYVEKRQRDGHRPYAPRTAEKQLWHLGKLVPAIGHMPVSTIEPRDILAPLRKLERKGNLETARRCLQFVGQVMRHAVATARLASDPSRDLQGALTTPAVTHYAAILDPVKLGGLLRAIDGYQGDAMTRLALQLAPMCSCAPASCAWPIGRKWISARRFGRYPRTRPKCARPMPSRCPGRRWPSLPNCRPSPAGRKAIGGMCSPRCARGRVPCRKTRSTPDCGGWAIPRMK